MVKKFTFALITLLLFFLAIPFSDAQTRRAQNEIVRGIIEEVNIDELTLTVRPSAIMGEGNITVALAANLIINGQLLSKNSRIRARQLSVLKAGTPITIRGRFIKSGDDVVLQSRNISSRIACRSEWCYMKKCKRKCAGRACTCPI